MWKALKDFFGIIGGMFKFLGELFEVVNSGLREVNDGLEKFNQDLDHHRLTREKEIKQQLDALRQQETSSHDHES